MRLILHIWCWNLKSIVQVESGRGDGYKVRKNKDKLEPISMSRTHEGKFHVWFLLPLTGSVGVLQKPEHFIMKLDTHT